MHYVATILLDENPPSRLYLIKRSPAKRIAPNLFTGVGGTVEKDEKPYDAAIRELFEETTISGIKLFPIGEVVVNDTMHMHYFSEIYPNAKLIEFSEGKISWVPSSTVFDLPLIPTFALFLKEWQKRSFSFKKPFTLSVQRNDLSDIFGKIIYQKITNFVT